MAIVNYNGAPFEKPRGVAGLPNYYELKATDSTTFFTSNLTRNFLVTQSLPTGYTTTGSFITFAAGQGLNLQLRSASATAAEVDLPNANALTRMFDIRWRITRTDMPSGRSDTTFAIVFAAANFRDDVGGSSTGHFAFVMDSPIPSRRRVKVLYRRVSQADVTVYTRTEASAGEFGPMTVTNNHLMGNVVRRLRLSRSRNTLYAEWNFEADLEDAVEHTNADTFETVYANRVAFTPNNGFNGNNNNNSIFGIATDGLIRQYIRGVNVAGIGDCTATVTISRIDVLPAMMLDTTSAGTGTDILQYTGDVVRFRTKERGEGFCDLAIDQWQNGSITRIQRSGDFVEMNRRETLTGNTASYLFDNKLRTAKTGDLKRDLYVRSVTPGVANKGNLYPRIGVTRQVGTTDNQYAITVCKEGYLEDVNNQDTTGFSLSGQTDPLKRRSTNFYGKNNLPTYVFSDGTYNLGRDAMFRHMENIVVTATGSEVPVQDQYKVFERDSTSYYVVEVVSDGTNFRVFTRNFNIYSKNLSARVAVNADYTVFNRNPTYSAYGADWFPLVCQVLKPNVEILKFPGKDVAALTVTSTTGSVSYRMFFETLNKGSSWFLRENSTRNLGLSFETPLITSGVVQDCFTFNIGTNRNAFFNLAAAGLAGVSLYYHRADNYARKPTFFSNLDALSALSPASDTSARYVHASYDPVQENLSLAVTYTSGFVQVYKSPRFPFDSVKNFNAGYDAATQLLNAFPPKGNWRSTYVSEPFSNLRVGKTLVAHDRNGDLVSVSQMNNDSTSFSISRTSALKDDLNLMGRFMQCAQKASARVDRFMNEMFTDVNGDIIMSSAAINSTFPLALNLSVMKYGQLSSITQELDYDEGFVYPQRPHVVSGTLLYDSTFNCWSIAGNLEQFGIHNIGTTVASLFRPLTKENGGWKMEWRSAIDTPDTVYTNFSKSLLVRLSGDALTSTTVRQVSFRIGWTQGSIVAQDAVTSFNAATASINQALMRRYLLTAMPTTDQSCRVVVYGENLSLSNYEKIIWDKYLDFVLPQLSSSTLTDGIYFQNFSGTDVLRVEYMLGQRGNAPKQPTRNQFCGFLGEKLATRDFSNLANYCGIPANMSGLNAKFRDGIEMNWSGIDGMAGDTWAFRLDSQTDPAMTVNKEPFMVWRSASDNTTAVVAYDATDQGLQFVTANVAVLKNANFRRCFVEGSTSSLLNAATVATFSKEVFFDIDTGTLPVDATNYGTSAVVPCFGKNWRPGEHIGRFAQFEGCRVDGTAFRHLAFKILDNAQDSLTLRTDAVRWDTTAGFRYVIYDPNTSVALPETFGQNFWRIRVPPNQTANPAAVGDETAQGAVFLEPYRELGEFDLGFMVTPDTDVDDDLETEVTADVRTTEFDDLSVVNVEFARPRRIKKVTYTNGSRDTMQRLKSMFQALHGSAKTLWYFDDQANAPLSFMLCTVANEPTFEEINDDIKTVSIVLEEIA